MCILRFLFLFVMYSLSLLECECALDCKNNGTLIFEGEDSYCQCASNFIGDSCEEFNCLHGLSTGSQYNPQHFYFNKRCLCDAGWTGQFCENKLISCGEFGRERDEKCVCDEDFEGDKCQFVTKCDRGSLSDGKCLCYYGWQGPFCDKIRCNHGTPLKNESSCECPKNFRGKHCDFCAEGAHSYYPHCDIPVVHHDISSQPQTRYLPIIMMAMPFLVILATLLLLMKIWSRHHQKLPTIDSPSAATTNDSQCAPICSNLFVKHKPVVFVTLSQPQSTWHIGSLLAYTICLIFLCCRWNVELRSEVNDKYLKMVHSDPTVFLISHFMLHRLGILLSSVGIVTVIVSAVCNYRATRAAATDIEQISPSAFCSRACNSKLMITASAVVQLLWMVIIASLAIIELFGAPQSEISKMLEFYNAKDATVIMKLESKHSCCGVKLVNRKLQYKSNCIIDNYHEISIPTCTDKLSESLIGTTICVCLMSLIIFMTWLLCWLSLSYCKERIKKHNRTLSEDEFKSAGRLLTATEEPTDTEI